MEEFTPEQRRLIQSMVTVIDRTISGDSPVSKCVHSLEGLIDTSDWPGEFRTEWWHHLTNLETENSVWAGANRLPPALKTSLIGLKAFLDTSLKYNRRNKK